MATLDWFVIAGYFAVLGALTWWVVKKNKDTANDYFQFTSVLNRHLTQQQKVAVIERMWRVAYADERLDAHELHLMHRIADLLHVPHPDSIAAKMRAKESQRQGKAGKNEGQAR